jgi:hypothetical protein
VTTLHQSVPGSLQISEDEVAKTVKKSGSKTQQPSAFQKLLRAGSDAKRLYDEPEFRNLVASALIVAAKALRGNEKAPSTKARDSASRARSAPNTSAKKAAVKGTGAGGKKTAAKSGAKKKKGKART